MSFTGGPIGVIGIQPSYVSELVTSAVSSNPIAWRGSGQTFQGKALQSLAGNLSSSVVNVALNSALGTEATGPQGIALDSGANVLASVITPFVTSQASAAINQNIEKTLQSAGPFGPLLSQVSSGLVDQFAQGVSNTLFGAASAPSASRAFPGGGGEAAADYGGSAYTLSDVVFSIQPANQGPQAFGTSSSSTTGNTLPFGEFTDTDFGFDYPERNNLKEASMDGSIFSRSPSDLDTFPAPEVSAAETFSGLGSSGDGGSAGQSEGWTFICAPEDVDWDTTNSISRVDMFGTNNPPVVSGTKGMRELSLNNALVEGFTRGVNVESKVASLEKLMEYGLNSSDGFVSVPVYQVWANSKSYGGAQAYFILESVSVKERMRDLQGNATRAYVDVSLTQVPAYQVNSGRDQAGEATAGGPALQSVQGQANGGVAGGAGTAGGAASAGGAGSTPATASAPATKASSGPSAPKPVQTTDPTQRIRFSASP